MFMLIVKGNEQEVTTALRQRKIGYFECNPHPKFNECSVLSHGDVAWETLALWFGEKRSCHPDVGFPRGTLLWYGPHHAR